MIKDRCQNRCLYLYPQKVYCPLHVNLQEPSGHNCGGSLFVSPYKLPCKFLILANHVLKPFTLLHPAIISCSSLGMYTFHFARFRMLLTLDRFTPLSRDPWFTDFCCDRTKYCNTAALDAGLVAVRQGARISSLLFVFGRISN